MIRRVGLSPCSLALLWGCSLGGQSDPELNVKTGDDLSVDGDDTQRLNSDAGSTEGDSILPGADGGERIRVGRAQELDVDFYREPCQGSEGLVLCSRLLVDDQEWVTAPEFNWDAFVWGHRYSVKAHTEVRPLTADGGADGEWVVDEILVDQPVTEGSRFVWTLNPREPVIPFVSVRSDSTGAIEGGPEFSCQPELCGALSEALGGQAEFNAAFRFDAETKLVLSELSGDMFSTPMNEFQVMRQAWLEKAPGQYVVKICGTVYSLPDCQLWGVDAESVVALERQDGSRDSAWEPVAVTGDEAPPFDELFERAARLSAQDCGPRRQPIFDFALNEPYGYLSELSSGCIEVYGTEVSCFAADTLDLEACRNE